jgi:hypothetical protein
MPIDSKISVIKAFDSFPNTIFLGIEKPSFDTMTKNCILRVLTPDQTIEVDKAHT